jgi:homocysteine S-methyltransferase
MLQELVGSGTSILTDAGVETRILFETGLELDPHLQVAGLLDRRRGREALRTIYAEYVDVAWSHGLPTIIGTPTFRASRRYVERSGRGSSQVVRRLNAEAVALLAEVRAAGAHDPVFIAGVVGPYGDACRPDDCLGHLDGADYHAEQVRALTDAGVDLLFAPTFPSIEEAHGVATAMSTTGLPYVVSFVLDDRGRVLDGTYLHAAIERIDDCVVPAPTWYSISCVHPDVARTALENLAVASSLSAGRLREVKANGSPAVTSRRGTAEHCDGDPPEVFGETMHQLGRDFAIPILGGCCGTGAQHLAALARRLEAPTT